MKTCNVCMEAKSLSMFSMHGQTKDKKQPTCKKCLTIRMKTRRGLAREMVQTYLKAHPCIDCGYYDIRALEFDHINDDKEANVADLVARGYSLERVKKEMDKCEVVCANCHRIRTLSRL